jgi:hypothetical protein
LKRDNIHTTLNYCAHAIEDMRQNEVLMRSTMPKSARTHGQLIGLLRRSVKFILPNCCDLFDPEGLRQTHLDLVRLPFPCVAFEVPWEKQDNIEQLGGFQQTPATKRIALCLEARSDCEPLLPGLEPNFHDFPEGGVFIIPIYWAKEYRLWTVATGGIFFPYSNVVLNLTPDDLPPASRIANSAIIDAGIAKERAQQFKAEPFPLLPEFFDIATKTYGGQEQALAQIILDSRDEATVLIQACSVINCANVTTVDVPPSPALNKKRQAKGNQPFFSYKVLQLNQDRHAPSGREWAGGHHESPRMHLRRGHPRRLESKTVWVRASLVGTKYGFAAKDYELRPVKPPAPQDPGGGTPGPDEPGGPKNPQ